MFAGSTANPLTRPEVKAGPIDRIRSPLNVGVDIGSRGVGDASGVGDGLAIARSGSRNRSEITVIAHDDMVINGFLLVVIEMELVETDLWSIRHRLTRITLTNAREGTRLCAATHRLRLRRYKPAGAD